MKNYILLLIIGLSLTSMSGQDIIEEFATSHVSLSANQTGQANNEATSSKMDVRFQLYTDKLIINYLDKKTIKTMKRIGQPSNIEYPYNFTREKNNQSIWYKYQDDSIQIKIILEGSPTPSVTIKSKDDFTGEITSTQLFYSMPNEKS